MMAEWHGVIAVCVAVGAGLAIAVAMVGCDREMRELHESEARFWDAIARRQASRRERSRCTSVEEGDRDAEG